MPIKSAATPLSLRDVSADALRAEPKARALLRIGISLLLLLDATMIVFNFPAAPEGMDIGGLIFASGLVELFGALLLLAGIWTRPVASLLAILMGLGYFLSFAQDGLFPAANGGTGALLFAFGFLYFALAGPGAYALDNWQPAERQMPDRMGRRRPVPVRSSGVTAWPRPATALAWRRQNAHA